MSRGRLGVLVAVFVLIAAVVLVVALPKQHTGTKLPKNASNVEIPMADGVKLKGVMVIPAHAKGSHKLPLLVMPGSWGSMSTEYAKIGDVLSAQGYAVVGYAQRGFGGSGGQVDFAGEKTQADVSSVIDWAVANEGADPKQIGVIGVSYGAGVSLLAAERDPRIKAVVAMSAWADLDASLDENNTIDSYVLSGLLAPMPNRSFDTQMVAVRLGLNAKNTAPAKQMLTDPQRSASSNVAELNKNGTAVMIANGFQDGLIPPNQLLPFFEQLTVPKRLELQAGGHSQAEAAGLSLGGAAGTTGVWKDALDWANHFVRGVSNGIDKQQSVQLKDMKTGIWHGYSSVAAATTSTASFGLGSTNPLQVGTLVYQKTSAWERTIDTGSATVADTGNKNLNGISEGLVVGLGAINQHHAATWTSSPLPMNTLVSGTPEVTLTVTPSSNDGTVFAYLYDVGPGGTATLMTFRPYTVNGSSAHTPATITIDLRTIEWTLAAGHQVSLVIDTVDSRYPLTGNPPGSTLTLSSTSAAPAELKVPIAS